MSQPQPVPVGSSIAALEARGRGRGRIGAMVPATNRNLEPDFVLLAPPGVSVHFVRIREDAADVLPDSASQQRFAHAPIEEPVRMLAEATVDVIAYGCTSATLSASPDFDAALGARIEALAGRPAITAARALIEALEALGVARIAFASPYVRELHERAVAFLGGCGLTVVSEADVGRDLSNYEQEMSPAAVYELGLRADDPSAEALVLSCTEMRAVEAIEALERELGKPVVSSNQALMFACTSRLGLDPSSTGAGGRLFGLAR